MVSIRCLYFSPILEDIKQVDWPGGTKYPQVCYVLTAEFLTLCGLRSSSVIFAKYIDLELLNRVIVVRYQSARIEKKRGGDEGR